MGRVRYILILVCAIAALLPAVIVAAETNVNVTVNSSGTGSTGTEIRGSINWDKGAIQAIGIGVPSSQAASQAQANA